MGGEADAMVGLIGLLFGLLGAAVGIGVVIAILRGSFSRVLATRPDPSVAPVSREVLLERLAALNAPDLPYEYRLGDGYDLVAEWRIADASWWGFFNRNRLRESYRAKVCLHDRYREARIYEERSSVRWTAGQHGAVPHVAWESQHFKGVVLFERSREVAYGLREVAPLDWGKVVDYDFDVWRVKGPIRQRVLESGWIYCPVTSESHLRADRPMAG